MKVYTEKEVKKLIKAFQEKYKDPGCEALPYQPESIYVEFFAVEKYPSKMGGSLLLKPSEKHPEPKMEFVELSEEDIKAIEFKSAKHD